MKAPLIIVALILPVFLAACERDGTYPLTGEECGPNDPVQTLDASDCTVPGV